VSDEISAANEHARRVREMFATIATRYDLLNHVLSANIDKRWRRLVAKKVGQEIPARGRVLDIACGTGDLSLTLFEITGAKVFGSDFCRPMLDLARKKSSRAGIPFTEGDALNLPFATNAFDAVTIAFGLRNLASVEDGLAEMFRVLRPGGFLAVLEFCPPSLAAFRYFFDIYFTRVLPVIGGAVSGSRQAYEYLPKSVCRFLEQEELAARIRDAGFDDISYENLTGGIAAIHSGKKPKQSL
jgi:demethylmenaquinone methyltransferase/2-methoxy-6-polyprenyl-1,4-benzoquinol methylase